MGRCGEVPDSPGSAGGGPAAGAAHPGVLRSAGRGARGQRARERAPERGGACARCAGASLRGGLVRASSASAGILDLCTRVKQQCLVSRSKG